MDVAALQDAARQIGSVRCAAAQLSEGCWFVSKGFKERKRKLRPVKGKLRQFGNCLFDLDRIHTSPVELGTVGEQGTSWIG